MDAYEELGLDYSSNPSQSDVKAAYQKLALRLHPDKCADKSQEAIDQFLRVKAAWEAIGTVEMREEYDSSSARAHINVTNAEKVPLDELEQVLGDGGEVNGYLRHCRCGDLYEWNVHDLADGFNTVQCNGCSLYITAVD